MTSIPPAAKGVSRRCVFYLGGFDPKGARHYHALYQEEGRRQGALDGWHLEVTPRRHEPSGNTSWQVHADIVGQPVDVHYEFMAWDDIVRRNWPRRATALWRDIVVTSCLNLANGTWLRMLRLSRPPAMALIIPFVLLLAVLPGVPVAGVGVAIGLLRLTDNGSLSVAGGLLTGALLWCAARRLDAHYGMQWLMRSYAFTTRQAQDRQVDIDERLDQHARRLAERISAQIDDEVLVVGHSSGSIMAASIVARASRLSPGLFRGRTRFGLLTLGQCIPMLSQSPAAAVFRSDLQTLAQSDGLAWVDFSSPADGCCFARTDPLASCGVRDRLLDLKCLNPRFASQFGAAAYAALKHDKLRLHFQYLCAAGLASEAGDYNYFEITAGPLGLREQYFGMRDA